jgi:hypothetical protein
MNEIKANEERNAGRWRKAWGHLMWHGDNAGIMAASGYVWLKRNE